MALTNSRYEIHMHFNNSRFSPYLTLYNVHGENCLHFMNLLGEDSAGANSSLEADRADGSRTSSGDENRAATFQVRADDGPQVAAETDGNQEPLLSG